MNTEDKTMNNLTVEMENSLYAGSRGVQSCTGIDDLTPAFLNTEDGKVEISRLRDGRPAAIHLIEWLPLEWADVIEMDGAIRELRPGIISGYVKNGLFITREDASEH